MTTFKQFLAEQTIDRIHVVDIQTIEKIAKDCKPYLKQIGLEQSPSEFTSSAQSSILYRGMEENAPMLLKQPRDNRIPTDTPDQIHQYIDQWFEQHFGIALRTRGVFASTTSGQASAYGKVYGILPVGKFSLIASPNVFDLFEHLAAKFMEHFDSSTKKYLNNNGFDQQAQQLVDSVLQQAEYQFYQPKEIANKFNYGAEVAMVCQAYYAFSLTDMSINDIMPKIWKINNASSNI